MWAGTGEYGYRRIGLFKGPVKPGADTDRGHVPPPNPWPAEVVGSVGTRPDQNSGWSYFYCTPTTLPKPPSRLRRGQTLSPALAGEGVNPLPNPFPLDAFGDSSPMCPSQNNFLDPSLRKALSFAWQVSLRARLPDTANPRWTRTVFSLHCTYRVDLLAYLGHPASPRVQTPRGDSPGGARLRQTKESLLAQKKQCRQPKGLMPINAGAQCPL